MQSWSHSIAFSENVNLRHYSVSSSELLITVTESLSQRVELNKMNQFRRVRSHVLKGLFMLYSPLSCQTSTTFRETQNWDILTLATNFHPITINQLQKQHAKIIVHIMCILYFISSKAIQLLCVINRPKFYSFIENPPVKLLCLVH